jgi:hypothetical protein
MQDVRKTYDVIVVGSGAAGGIAAKELTEGGLEVIGAINSSCISVLKIHRHQLRQPTRLRIYHRLGIGSPTRAQWVPGMRRSYSTCWRFRAIRTPLSRTTVWLMKS